MQHWYQKILSPAIWQSLLELVFFSCVLVILLFAQISLFCVIFITKNTPLTLPHAIARLAHQINLIYYDTCEYLSGNTDNKPSLF